MLLDVEASGGFASEDVRRLPSLQGPPETSGRPSLLLFASSSREEDGELLGSRVFLPFPTYGVLRHECDTSLIDVVRSQQRFPWQQLENSFMNHMW